ncbi:hypothetical protein BDB00DRAFT_789012 [Zychaea mexicana]|uniref:uncharacterized protein n=1 Tax=Zychaea mexicana TaxID=64656 RepID=UPI0022FE3388|nr:uncharacterized protein BDB00DRAFT_789012 [Zychaea mexicana]KAI9492047.1 hypothetical protein BDB00DRAFT_789012 [Zychaea mexicana]
MQHADCTESFYKDSITEEIRSRGATTEEEKQNMLQLLRKFEAENDAAAAGSDNDVDEDDGDDDDDNTADLQERFANIDLENADSAAIWTLLTENERKEFEALLQQQDQDSSILLPQYQPWWKKKSEHTKIIEQFDEDGHDDDGDKKSQKRMMTMLPELPNPLPDLEAMMKPRSPPGPESDLIWSLMHTAIAYCYLMRHFLGDVREDVKDTVAVLSKLCKATLFSSAPGCAYKSANDAAHDLVDVICEYEQDTSDKRKTLMLMLLDDCLSLLEKQDSMVRALTDVWQLLEAGVKRVDKTDKKACFLAARKAYFYLGYGVHLARNLGLGRIKLSVMTERERLLLEERSFDRERKAVEQALKLQKQANPKIAHVN